MSYVPANNNIRWKDKVGGSRTVFEGNVKTRVGGAEIAVSELPEYPNVLPMGTPIYQDEIARVTTVHYEFEVAEKATSATEVKIVKGPEGTRVKVGMALMAEQTSMETGATAVSTVTAVDSSNADYDIVTIDAAASFNAGAILWEANPTSKNSKYYVKVKPNGLTDVDLVAVPGTYSVKCASVYFSDSPILLRRLPALSKVVRKYMNQEEFCYFNWAEHK
ncbi:MAG: hypothetical protein MJZ30_06200 [Paludibacteraceae bacterium]|nr:hypothetical protein [Paludibacteraceae bacterium]